MTPRSRGLDGRVAQRESTAFTRQGSLVQSQSRPPFASMRTSDPFGSAADRCAATMAIDTTDLSRPGAAHVEFLLGGHGGRRGRGLRSGGRRHRRRYRHHRRRLYRPVLRLSPGARLRREGACAGGQPDRLGLQRAQRRLLLDRHRQGGCRRLDRPLGLERAKATFEVGRDAVRTGARHHHGREDRLRPHARGRARARAPAQPAAGDGSARQAYERDCSASTRSC